MKFFAVALLLTVCVVQNATADWKSNISAYYSHQFNTLVSSTSDRIRNDASASGKPDAMTCYHNADTSLGSISFNGINQVASCVSNAVTEADANACCQQVQTSVINQEQVVSQSANRCISSV